MPSIKPKPTMATHMTALRSDIKSAKMSVGAAKGLQVKPASVMDIKAWLDKAVKSPDDAVKPFQPKGVPVGGRMVPLGKKEQAAILNKLDAKVTAEISRNASIKGGETKRPSQAELREWVTNALVEASVGQVKVAAKGGQARAATADEIRSWLN